MPFITPRVRKARQAAGRKTGEFARAVNLSRGHLINAEGGRVPISIEALHRVATELGIDKVEDLIEDRSVA